MSIERKTCDSKSNIPFWANLAFACKTETLGSLYSHALLILLYPDSGISMDEEIVLGNMIWSYNKAEL